MVVNSLYEMVRGVLSADVVLNVADVYHWNLVVNYRLKHQCPVEAYVQGHMFRDVCTFIRSHGNTTYMYFSHCYLLTFRLC